MEQHVTSVCRAKHYHLHNIRKIRRFLLQPPLNSWAMHSLLDYCNALFRGLPSSLIGRMQRIQNIAARIVTRLKASDHITPVLRQLHWLPIVQRIKFKVSVQVFKCVNGIAPDSSKHHSSASAITNSAVLLSTADRCSFHPPQWVC